MPFTAYGFFAKLAIRYIARRRGKRVKTSEDHDLTDYAALETDIHRPFRGSRASRKTGGGGTMNDVSPQLGF
jgi:hypothetical protein